MLCIRIGKASRVLEEFRTQSFHCCVTSPPYYNQRDYGVKGQIGVEETVEEYLSKLKDVFTQVHRVLRNDGTLFVNIGDAYIDKELQGIPWMFAEMMRASGWRIRNEIIWWKRNAMTETASNRCGRDHETIFLFTKVKDGYFFENYGSTEKTKDGRNRPHRTVWDIPTKSFKGSHFAVFPVELAKRCILLGASNYGCCKMCHAPFKCLLIKKRIPTRPGNKTKTTNKDRKEIGNRDPQRHITLVEKIGWEPTCICNDRDIDLCAMVRVLDPFCGSGTTGIACKELNKKSSLYVFTGIELNKEYAEMAINRIANH